MKSLHYGLIAIILLLLASPAAAVFDPKSYIEEKATYTYNTEGQLTSQSHRGTVEVLTKDVLQKVQFDLSGIQGTNLESKQAYRTVLASPDVQKVKLLLNTTRSDRDHRYRIDSNITPQIMLNVDYQNQDGGHDLHSGSNTVLFYLTLSSDQELRNVEFRFQTPLDLGAAGQDAFDLRSPHCSVASVCDPTNTDPQDDNDDETFVWEGNLNPHDQVTLSFEGVTTPGINFPESQLSLDMTQGSYRAQSEQAPTYTGMTIGSQYAKSNIRNGIYMSKISKAWKVSGFIKNRADHLTYRVDGWDLYRVGNDTAIKSSKSSYEEYIGPSQSLETRAFVTEEDKKQYFLSTFDWEVVWGDADYRGKITSQLEFYPFYELTSDLNQYLTLQSNDQRGREVQVRQVVRNLGHEEVNPNQAKIFGRIPNQSQQGVATAWEVDRAKVLYRNSTSTYPIVNASIETRTANQSSPGYVIAEVDSGLPDFNYLGQNEDLILKYTLTSPHQTENLSYTFGCNSTLWTPSGTPDVQTETSNLTIPGVEETPEGGGGGGMMPMEEEGRLEVGPVAEDSTSNVVSGNIVKVEMLDEVIDTGTKGARDLGIQILIPQTAELLAPSLEVEYERNGSWRTVSSENITVNYQQDEMVDQKSYQMYNVDLKGGGRTGFTLYDQEAINVQYRVRTSYGANELITRLRGYNYYEDRVFYTDFKSKVRVKEEIMPLQVTEMRWEQDRALVGEPTRWRNTYRIENPNNMSLDKTVRVKLPQGATSCTVDGDSLEIEQQEGQPFMEWQASLDPLEEKNYSLRAYTPPVTLISEEETVLRSEEEWVTFLRNMTFKSYGDQQYENVKLITDLPGKQILDARGEHGSLPYNTSGDETEVNLGSFAPGEESWAAIEYKELPPILTITSDSYNYTRRESANLTTIVVARGNKTTGRVEITVTGPGSSNQVIYSDLISLSGNKTSRFVRKIDLRPLPEGKYTVRANYRRNFANVLSEETIFWAGIGKEAFLIKDWHMLVLLVIFASSFAFRIYEKKERYKERLEEIRKKTEETFK